MKNMPDFLQQQDKELPLGDMIEESTIYHTPVGDLEIPVSSHTQEEAKATYKSNLAPMWLIFPKHIINTQRIVCMYRAENCLRIATSDDRIIDIAVSDLEKTWSSLQKVFADGVSE